MNLAINFLAFQFGWFACVLGAAHGMPWLGPVAVLLAVLLHLRLIKRPRNELKLIACAMVLGLLLDSILLASGWLDYPSGSWLPGIAPYWLISMWALFATTLNVSMKWMRGRPALAVVMGAIGGPLSYLAGQKLGAMSFNDPVFALTGLAVAWSLAMPLLVALAVRFDDTAKTVKPAYVQSDWRVSNHV
jgi:hypothetical protein